MSYPNNSDPYAITADELAEVERMMAELAEGDGNLKHALHQLDQAKAEVEALREALAARVQELEDAMRLIELLGYREGEDFGWINAHMRGVAHDVLNGTSIAHYWRLFPNHRAAALAKKEAKPYPCPYLQSDHLAQLAEAEARGMERAAKACDRRAGNASDFDRYTRRAAGMCAADIRAEAAAIRAGGGK